MAVKRILDPELFLPSIENIGNPAFWYRLLEIPKRNSFLLRPNAYRQFVELYVEDLNALRNPRDIQRVLAQLMGKLDKEEVEENNILAEKIGFYSPHLGRPNNTTILKNDFSSVPRDAIVVLATARECWQAKNDYSEHGLFLHTKERPEEGDADRTWNLAEREEFIQSKPSFEELSDKRYKLFPQLRFSRSAWDQVGKIKKEPNDTISRIIKHLCILNDEAPRLWKEHTENNSRISALGALAVEASPENGNVLGNSKLKDERNFRFHQPDVSCDCEPNSCDGHVKNCHWHTKLYRDTGRIHFKVEDDFVYIGTMTDHLSLQGK